MFKKYLDFKKLGSTAFLVMMALTFRWAIAEAYVIPSESMDPTLKVNNRIFVNKFTYGMRVPFTKLWLTHFNEPKRGEVIVFKYPVDESTFFVKRIIGLPGDEIYYTEEGALYVNQKLADESSYQTQLRPGNRPRNFGPVVVPQDSLFVMGDNRDNSSDSRVWGFVPRENIVGRADLVWWRAIN